MKNTLKNSVAKISPVTEDIFLNNDLQPPQDALRADLSDYYLQDETQVVETLLKKLDLNNKDKDQIGKRAHHLVQEVRKQRLGKGGIDAFMHEFQLSSQEGVVLMCLAEALLRIPDADTADRLIRDKLGTADWEKHLGQSDSVLVNASTWALMLTGQFVSLHDYVGQPLASITSRLANRLGEPVIRQAVTQGMRIMGRQFVLGQNINAALKNSKTSEKQGYSYSYDMLGEAARSAEDAERYYQSYLSAITAIGETAADKGAYFGPGISIKLSALHPRYSYAQQTRTHNELLPKLIKLCQLAKQYQLGLTLDSEEADRLEPSLDLLAALCTEPSLADWQGLGIAVQAYQKRALPQLVWLCELASLHERRLMVRLVKGAYWDTEIKQAQELGLSGYPVFSRKASTDVSYLACAQYLMQNPKQFYSQFATHNAHTVAAILHIAGENRDFEFQRLHGMGEPLYAQLIDDNKHPTVACRIYAPVGSHEDLLAYLVRRLLENGANSSFVNRIVDEAAPIEEIIADPINKIAKLDSKPHPQIPLPLDLFGSERKNAQGPLLSDWQSLQTLKHQLEQCAAREWEACSLIGGQPEPGRLETVTDPSDHRRIVGKTKIVNPDVIDKAMQGAAVAQISWDKTSAPQRAAILDKIADLFETHHAELMYLAIREAGKTLPDAVAEVREAVDFCRYYASLARRDFSVPVKLHGPTGEINQIRLHGRGVFICISPWNFPLAIFCGQVCAALAAGNSVVAKPAEQTPLIAFRAVQLMHQAGIPGDVLQLLLGDGASVGANLVKHPLVAGVAFTGSTEVAQMINRSLAARSNSIVPLIAETGGQNVMIVDSSALAEQVIDDVIASAFQSAGQRCSALRVLCVQEDIADKVIRLLKGAMQELCIGDPALLSTDLGPVIDIEAKQILEQHIHKMRKAGKLIYQCDLAATAQYGYFVPPTAFEITSIAQLEREVFGPVLHVLRYSADDLDGLIDNINATGYGLTLGIHSRIDATVQHIHQRVKVGNVYVNRSQIGAVVGVQPFGGEGLSGTGPKAGGPRYLHRFATERCISINTTAQGGNAALMSLGDTDE